MTYQTGQNVIFIIPMYQAGKKGSVWSGLDLTIILVDID